MKFSIPIDKNVTFAQELFALISEHVSDLSMEYEKMPNKIIFTGQIGKEVFDFIKEKDWNFKGFNLESASGLLDALIFKYDAPFTQTEDRGGVIFDGGSIHNKQINGIPGPDTTQKLISAYASPSFIIERTVRPEKRILLVRK
jgi:hypothetical protein